MTNLVLYHVSKPIMGRFKENEVPDALASGDWQQHPHLVEADYECRDGVWERIGMPHVVPVVICRQAFDGDVNEIAAGRAGG